MTDAEFRPIITPVREMLRDARLGLYHFFSRHILRHMSDEERYDEFDEDEMSDAATTGRARPVFTFPARILQI